jgi:hypothetical protein
MLAVRNAIPGKKQDDSESFNVDNENQALL